MSIRCEFLPYEYGQAIVRYVFGKHSINPINGKIFEYVKGGVRIYYPDGVIRFISNSWEGEMFV